MSEATRGQSRRKQIRETIEANLSRYCPDTIDRLADRIAYDYNLSPYTVRYTYLPMFITVGVLKSLGNGVYSTEESETPFTDSVKQKQQEGKVKQK